MTGKIKVALCLSGEARSSMFCFPYIYETFLKPHPLYDVDVYIHTWKGFRALELYNPKNYYIDILNEEKFYIDYYDTFISNSKEFNQILKQEGKISNYASFLKNSTLMLYSIQKSFQLIKNRYDICIRSRIDLFFPTSLKIYPIILDLIHKKYDIFLPKDFNSLQYNDQLAIGNFESMEIYCNLFNHIPKLIDKTNSSNCQVWLKSYLKDHNLKVEEKEIELKLARKSNVITNDPYFFNFLDQ